ncbi:LytTR family DNA-binding domain-containing protein [Blautia wexlerae]|uniref:LytTR family DNA-binding domain-containing protein n=1 Tax=Blautia wexlerae TaxID=418240 RepID=UPI001FA95039
MFFAFSILFVSIFLLDFKVVEFNGKLKEIAKKIPGNFIQIHQSYLINFDYIEECSYESVKMKNGDTIPISQPYRKSVRKQLAERVWRERE